MIGEPGSLGVGKRWAGNTKFIAGIGSNGPAIGETTDSSVRIAEVLLGQNQRWQKHQRK